MVAREQVELGVGVLGSQLLGDVGHRVVPVHHLKFANNINSTYTHNSNTLAAIRHYLLDFARQLTVGILFGVGVTKTLLVLVAAFGLEFAHLVVEFGCFDDPSDGSVAD